MITIHDIYEEDGVIKEFVERAGLPVDDVDFVILCDEEEKDSPCLERVLRFYDAQDNLKSGIEKAEEDLVPLYVIVGYH